MKRRPARRGVALFVAAVAVVATAGGGAVAATDVPRGAVVAADFEPPCLNVLASACNFAPAWMTAGVALPGAFRIRPDYSFEPMLVERVDVGTAPFTLTYRIRDAAVWSDGVPVTADDFLFTLETIRNPANAVVSRAGYDLITEATAADAKTVRFVFDRPYAPWRALFPSIYPKHALVGADFSQLWRTDVANPATGEPIGSGPFLVSSREPGQSITLTRNPRWWGTRPQLDSVVVRFILDTNAKFEALRSGAVDVFAPQPQFQVGDLRTDPAIVVDTDAGATFDHVDFNLTSTTMPLLGERWFRQAVAYALDRDALFPALYSSISPDFGPLQSLVYPIGHHDYDAAFGRYSYRPDLVAELMESHGCVRGADAIWACDGRRASIKLATTTGNFLRAETQRLLQAKAREAGIELVPDNSPAGVLFGVRLPALDYELILFSWTRPAEPNGEVALYGCGGVQNTLGYCSATVTDLLTRADAEVDVAARAALLNESNRQLAEDVPSAPLFARPTFLAYRNRLAGPENNPAALTGALWNVETWCIVGTCDAAAPSTTAQATPAANGAGWNRTPVTITLTADDAGGSGVSEITYRLAGAASETQTVTGSSATLTISAEGLTTLTYFARDLAGNVESEKTLTVRIDTTPPTVACAATPWLLWPANHRLVSVQTTVNIADTGSGASGFVLREVTSNEPDSGLRGGDRATDVQGFTLATADTAGQLRAERSPKGDGRVYTIAYEGADVAGNRATCRALVVVPRRR